jgi:UrcA family protein
MNTILCRSVCSLSLIAALAAVPARSWADAPPQAAGEPVSLTVRISDLNTATPEGARVLYGRIKSAATKACAPSSSAWVVSDFYPKWQACYREAVDHTVSQLNLPALTALHRSVTPVPAGHPALAGNR